MKKYKGVKKIRSLRICDEMWEDIESYSSLSVSKNARKLLEEGLSYVETVKSEKKIDKAKASTRASRNPNCLYLREDFEFPEHVKLKSTKQ